MSNSTTILPLAIRAFSELLEPKTYEIQDLKIIGNSIVCLVSRQKKESLSQKIHFYLFTQKRSTPFLTLETSFYFLDEKKPLTTLIPSYKGSLTPQPLQISLHPATQPTFYFIATSILNNFVWEREKNYPYHIFLAPYQHMNPYQQFQILVKPSTRSIAFRTLLVPGTNRPPARYVVAEKSGDCFIRATGLNNYWWKLSFNSWQTFLEDQNQKNIIDEDSYYKTYYDHWTNNHLQIESFKAFPHQQFLLIYPLEELLKDPTRIILNKCALKTPYSALENYAF